MMFYPYFQINLDLRKRSCLVLGGEKEAADKTLRLLDAEARVTVASPTLNRPLQRLAARGRIRHLTRGFETSDLKGKFLVINTLKHDAVLSDRLLRLANRNGILLSTYDRPQYSNCSMPAVVRRGLLRIAISTSGAGPGLSKRLREDLERVFDRRFAAYLNRLARLRSRLAETEPDSNRRMERMRQAVREFRLSGRLVYPKPKTR
jgi:precorrin-2 dehydrogenase/sirohydrochlorin ferrochelatase